VKRTLHYSADKALGLMLGMVFGNSLGALFNDKNPGDVSPVDEEFLQQHPLKYYSADIQTAVSVLEELGENGQIDQSSLQHRFSERYSPWRGYGGGMLDVINLWKDGGSIAEAAASLYNGTGNFGDGAAVRSGPISLFFALDEIGALFEQVSRASLITHTHSYGVAGAQLQAAAVLLALNDVPPDQWISPIFKLPIDSAFKIKLGDLVQCIEKKVSAAESVTIIGNAAEAIEAVPAALFAALRYPDSLFDAVAFAVSMCGDADTIGAMTGAIVGARLGIKSVPLHLIKDVEKGQEDVEFIRNLIKRCGSD